MKSILDHLRESRKHPSVLKIRVLKIWGQDPQVPVFIYEGPEDVPVYDEWLKRIDGCPRFEPLPGAGKQQLLAYHQYLIDNADPSLHRTFFFIDRDFDDPVGDSPHVFELNAYSVENVICGERAVENVLLDEFRRTGRLDERRRVLAVYAALRESMFAYMEKLHWHLFVAQRSGIRVEKKPDRITDIFEIQVDALHPKMDDIGESVQLENRPCVKSLEKLLAEFNALPRDLRERGKYVLDFLRQWLRLLAADIKSAIPKIFDEADARLPGDPSSVSMRRLASSVGPPIELVEFMNKNFAAPQNA